MNYSQKLLVYCSILANGDWKKMYELITQGILEKRPIDLEEKISKVKSGVLTMLDENYPSYIKSMIACPPFVLYYYGDISLISDFENNIAVVGSRECTEYGIEATKDIVKHLSKKYVIVSGMAEGIDSVAHQTAIKNKGKTIAVLGTGIDKCYPASSKDIYDYLKKNKVNLIISEHPLNCCPMGSFPARNRLIAGFSRATIVTEAHDKSGTSITATCALEQGKDVLCVPYDRKIGSFCNYLIKNGAGLIEDGKDALFELERWKK